MPPVEHVQVAVMNGEARTGVRPIAYPRAKTDTRPLFQLDGYRYPVVFCLLLLWCNDDLFETFGVGKTPLGLSQLSRGERLTFGVGQIPAQETVRKVGRSLNTRSAEGVFTPRVHRQVEGGCCGCFLNADLVPGKFRIKIAKLMSPCQKGSFELFVPLLQQYITPVQGEASNEFE